jgi:hypothetical protein
LQTTEFSNSKLSFSTNLFHFIDGEKTMSTFTASTTLKLPVRGNSLHDEGKSFVAQTIEQWQNRLSRDCGSNPTTQNSVMHWLIGEDLDRFERFTPAQIEVVSQGLNYRYRVLRQRYLGVSPTKAYKNLIQRLGGLAILQEKIRAWVSSLLAPILFQRGYANADKQ